MRVCPTCFGLFAPDQEQCPKDRVDTVHHADILIGMSLGPYIVRSQLSEGGMGVVYAGEHPTLGRRVALKVLRPELALRDNIVERFAQEARAVNTIGHQNIVSIYDFGRTPYGSFYFVMEYLDGRTVRSIVEEGGPQPLSRTEFILSQVGEALSAAHAKGFLHRDVKPENIMVCKQGGRELVKLLDFGIAKLQTTASTESQTGMAMGTPQYMAPEQLEDRAVDTRVDVYALGVVTYELLTGRVPYTGSSHAAVRQLQLTQAPPPPSVCRRDVHLSRGIDAAVLKALNLDPDQRFTSIEELVTAFRRAHQETLAERHHSRSPGSSPRRSWKLLAGSALLVAAAVATTLALLPADPGGVKDQPIAHRAPDAAGPTRPALAPAAAARREVQLALTSPAPTTRLRAVELLGQLQRRSMEPALRKALSDDDPRVRREAATALGNLGQVEPETIEALNAALTDRRIANRWVRVDIATALALLGNEAGRRHLRRELASAKGMMRVKLLESLGQANAAEGAELARHTDTAVVETRMRRLGYLATLEGHPEVSGKARRALEAALTVDAWDQRLAAAHAYAQLDPDRAKAVLAAALQGAPPDVKLKAAAELARLGDARGGEILVESLSSADEQLAVRIALALGRLGSGIGDRVLARALRQGEPSVRLAAAVALLKR